MKAKDRTKEGKNKKQKRKKTRREKETAHTFFLTHVQHNMYISMKRRKTTICVFAIGTVQEVRFVEKHL